MHTRGGERAGTCAGNIRHGCRCKCTFTASCWSTTLRNAAEFHRSQVSSSRARLLSMCQAGCRAAHRACAARRPAAAQVAAALWSVRAPAAWRAAARWAPQTRRPSSAGPAHARRRARRPRSRVAPGADCPWWARPGSRSVDGHCFFTSAIRGAVALHRAWQRPQNGPRGELPWYGAASPMVGGLQSTHTKSGGHAPGCRKGQAPRRAARVNQAMHRRAAPDAARTAALTGGHAYEVEKGWSRATAPQHRPPPQAPQSPRRSQRPPPAPRPPQRCTLCRATAGLRRPAAARAALGARPACRPARPRLRGWQPRTARAEARKASRCLWLPL